MEDTASLVALVEAPDPRRKHAILKAYKNETFTSEKEKKDDVFTDEKLKFLRGKRISIKEWAEGGETYELTGEKKAILCMHLWSLMRRASSSDSSDKIWEAISKGWPECVPWGKEYYGHFWGKIDHKRGKNEHSLRDQAENKGLLTILDAYKDMERHFKEDNQHLLVNWPSAYHPGEDNPNPTLDLWMDMIRDCTKEDAESLRKCLNLRPAHNICVEEP